MIKRLFKIVQYTQIDRLSSTDRVTDIEMYVPGVNSGSYDIALYIVIRGFVDVKRRFGKSKKQRAGLHITLPKDKVRELRDECNQILELLEK